MSRARPLLALALSWTLACAHAPRSTGLPGLKTITENFHQRIRWKDYRGAADLLAPERRHDFLEARHRLHDEEDLSITDYELQDARLSADTMHARVVSRISWTRLPSDKVNTETVTSDFAFRDGSWYLEDQDAGPFLPELKEVETPPPARRPRSADVR